MTLVSTESDGPQLALTKMEQMIDDARNGRIYIPVDDQNRESEEDLNIPDGAGCLLAENRGRAADQLAGRMSSSR